jgi:NTP pyrophosphatase (non-canonical NTP hydrolase)
MTYDELKKRALEIRDKYDQLNLHNGQNVWQGKDYAMGMVGDVGDLMKLIMASENMRGGRDVESRIGHELSDILWSLILLADIYEIDFTAEFERTMKYLDKTIAEKMKS